MGLIEQQIKIYLYSLIFRLFYTLRKVRPYMKPFITIKI